MNEPENVEQTVPPSEMSLSTLARQNPIITFLDGERYPLLQGKSQMCDIPLTDEDEEAIKLMDAILNDLGDGAAGLAAPQVGHLRRIFLLRNGKDKDGRIYNNAYINPVIIHRSRETKRSPEACLSLPGMSVNIKRPKSLVLEYTDINGQLKRETFKGLFAKCVAHEMSHLEGRLINQDLLEQVTNQPKRHKCGMVINDAKRKELVKRRQHNKRAHKARLKNRK